jgi:hypothetical protein
MITADVAHLRLRPSRQTVQSPFATRPYGPLGPSRLVRRETFPSVMRQPGEHFVGAQAGPSGCCWRFTRASSSQFTVDRLRDCCWTAPRTCGLAGVKTGGDEPVACPCRVASLCAAPPVGGAFELLSARLVLAGGEPAASDAARCSPRARRRPASAFCCGWSMHASISPNEQVRPLSALTLPIRQDGL